MKSFSSLGCGLLFIEIMPECVIFGHDLRLENNQSPRVGPLTCGRGLAQLRSAHAIYDELYTIEDVHCSTQD